MENHTQPVPCDVLIEPRWLIPVEPEGVVLEGHALAISAGRIAAIGPAESMRQRFQAKSLLERREHALIPGLVNAHAHSAMTLLRGLADDLPLMPWLNEHIWPTEAAFVGPDMVRDGTELAIAEQFLSGISCMNEMYFFPEIAAEAAIRLGMRAAVGAPILEFPTPYASGIEAYFEKAQALLQRFAQHQSISATLAPHAPYTVSDQSFERLRDMSARYQVQVHCHVHETAQEIIDSEKQFGMRPIERLRRLGLINSRLAAVHMTQLTPAEIALIAEQGVSVLHCPESNLKLASGFCPSGALDKAGVNLALGTDGCASNNDLDLLGELKTAALLAKAVAQDATALAAARALRMATLGGARAMGLQDQIGSLLPGKQADLTLIHLGDFDAMPVYHPISQIVYANHRHQVSDVFVAGQARVRNHALVDIDRQALAHSARRWGAKIGSRT
jgi:5-methylthioadenosine/S-adenosylhomocysteine deaminase